MAGIEEIAANIDMANTAADEAWDLASQAKEKAQAARMLLAALTREHTPKLLGEAIDLLDKAYATFESGQANCTASQNRMDDYKNQIGA